MSTEYIKSQTKTLNRQYQSQDLYPTRTIGNKLRSKNVQNYSDKWEKNKVKGIRQVDVPGNEGQDQSLSTTSQMFKKIMQNNNNNNKVNSSYSKKLLSCHDCPCSTFDNVEHKHDEDRSWKWTEEHGSPEPKKLKTSSQNFTLFSSTCSPVHKKQVRLRRQFGHAVVVTSPRQVKAEIERLTNAHSKLIITKRFEFFPTRIGDHNICYFSIKNNCRYLIAYKVSSSCQKLYKILPDTSYVPPGKVMNFSIKYLTKQIRLEDMENDQIIFNSCFIPGNIQIDQFSTILNTTPPNQMATWKIGVKSFFVHPCTILPTTLTDYHSHPIIESIPPPPFSSMDITTCPRYAMLVSQNEGEKIFEPIISQLTILYPQLKRLRRLNFILSILLNVTTYSIFVSLLMTTFYISTSGTAKLDERESSSSSLPSDYSDSLFLVQWFYQCRDLLYSYYVYTDNNSHNEDEQFISQIMSNFMTIFLNFLHHPLATCLDFMSTKAQVSQPSNPILQIFDSWW